MKVTPYFTLLIFTFQFGFSQIRTTIIGKVVCNDFAVKGIEVINLVSEKSTVTNSNGEFSILAKAEDMLVFVSKDYEYKRFFLEKEYISKANHIISLVRKPEELEEVVVTKISFPKVKFDQEAIDKINLEKAANTPKVIGVYTGTIVNGSDLMRIGGMILSLFIKDKHKKEVLKIEFKKLATASCSKEYFDKTLHLKPDEVALFLDFCDADPKSKIVIENANPLSIMDFLFSKNIEFKKLAPVEK
jgi:hypothetical protein